MTPVPIRVECYAGGRADERPRRILIGGRQHVVARLLCESVKESLVEKERTHRYVILTNEGLVLEILRNSDGAWYLQSELPAHNL